MRRIVIYVFAIMAAATAVSAQGTAPSATPASITAEQLTRLERAENRLKDWPNLARYREANAATPAPAKDENRVVFLGDSITDSWKLAEYFPGKPYINRGISGQTTPQMLIRFRPDVIALRPKVVVILAGTNDIAGNTGLVTVETIEGNLLSIFELARANSINIVIASVLPVSDYNKNNEGKQIVQTVRRPPGQILELNRRLKDYSSKNGLVYLDYFTAMADEKGFLKEELARDGLHPNAKGYEVMKTLAEQAINTALKKKRKK